MKNPIILALLFVTSLISLLGVNDVFAVTCTISGNTTNCSDPETGKGTTYNQYGDKIYGSDGSTATIYNDPVYNMGSGVSPVSLAGIDMDSPEMKEALRKYEEGCPSGGGFNGGAQAATCRNAVVEWLKAVSNEPRFESSDDYELEDDYSDYSESSDESLDEWTQKLLSDFGITNESSQSGNLCVSKGIQNSHPENNLCVCDGGFIQTLNKGCIPLNQSEYCPLIEGVPFGNNDCACRSGYTFTKLDAIEKFDINGTLYGTVYKCMSNSTQSEAQTSVVKKETNSEVSSVNFEVKLEDILPLNETGNINAEAVLRECPSTQCSKIESYPKGTVVEIMGKYNNDTWLKVNVINSKTGWMHQSLVDTVIEQIESGNDTSEPIKMTRAEYETKFGVPVPTEVEAEPVIEKVSLWKKVLSWFGF